MMSVAFWDMIYFRIGSEDRIEELLIRLKDHAEQSEYPIRVQILQGELGNRNNLYKLGFSGTDLMDLIDRIKQK